MIYSIYKITNKINDKKYIGFTSKTPPEKRWKEHQIVSKHCDYYLSRAIRKYGSHNFMFEVICQSTNRAYCLRELEPHFIKELNTLAPNGYNCTTGGDCPELCEATKQKIREKCLGHKNSFYGKKHNSQTRKKMSDFQRSEHNPNHGRKFGPSPFRGIPLTDEVKTKIQNTYTAERIEQYRKNNVIFDYIIETPAGKLIRTRSMKQFCKEHNLNLGHMSERRNCKGFKVISKNKIEKHDDKL